MLSVFFFQAEDGIRDVAVTGVQTCALPISRSPAAAPAVCCWRGSGPRDSLPCGGQRAEYMTWRLHDSQAARGRGDARVAGAIGGASEIGRAAGRERGEISVVAVSFKKKKKDRVSAARA